MICSVLRVLTCTLNMLGPFCLLGLPLTEPLTWALVDTLDTIVLDLMVNVSLVTSLLCEKTQLILAQTLLEFVCYSED